MPRDTRTYITVHDGMPWHPKIEGLSDKAFRTLLEVWCWSSQQHSDGFIKEASWKKRGSPSARRELLAEGLVEVAVVEGLAGVQIHDYTKHQRTADEIAAQRERNARNGRKGGLAKAAHRADNNPESDSEAVASG